LEITKGDYETIAGYITSELGRIPAKSEVFTIGQYTFTVLRSNKTRVDLVKLFIEPDLIEDM
jgi:CBS domain containing-hemolysin-like protein